MLLLASIWPAAVEAQAPAQVHRIGLLSPGQIPNPPPPDTIRPHLAAIGYVDGRNVIYELRNAEGRPERLPELAADLVRSKVDVIVAISNPAAFAAKGATSSIPIVVWAAHGAVDTGLVNSLARPGGNVTGVESLAPELDAKRLQILKEIVPGLAKVGVLYDGQDQGSPLHLKSVQAAARILKLEVVPLEMRRAEDLDRVFPAAKAFDALLTFTSALTAGPEWKRAADHALAQRMPTMCEFRFYVQLYGCLIAYGPTFDEISLRNAQQIDRILKGAKPADLPFEQVTRFPMVVNKKTAAAIGVTIPRTVMLAADEVIE
jgi:putative ABC transport system substrate-binding protein